MFAVGSIVAALLGAGVWSPVIGTYLQYAALVVTSWALVGWRPGRAQASWRLWRELVRYGLPLTGYQLVSRTQGFLKGALTGRLLGAAALGQLRYGTRLARLPLVAILEVGAYALLPAFARAADDRARLTSMFVQSLRWATIGVSGFTALQLALGEPFVVLLLGDRWRDAGIVAVSMSGLGIGYLWTTIASEAIKGAGQTRLIHWQTATDFVVNLGALLLLIGPLGLVGVGLTVSIACLTVGFVMLVVARRVVELTGKQMLGILAPSVLAMFVTVAALVPLDRMVVHSADHSVGPGVLLLFAEILVGVCLYLVVSVVLDRELGPQLLAGIRKLRRRTASSSS
jgi:PST family polysaccharide transporter